MSGPKLMNCRFPRPEAYCRLICFPWAGGGSNFYANWGKDITDNLEVHAVTLPGRESRFKEPCINDPDAVVKACVDKINEDFSEKPFAFFGHSMGSLLAFEIARQLKLQHRLEPRRMYLSGISAPHSEQRKANKTKVDSLTDEEFKEYLRKLGGTPSEILDNQDMLSMFLPPLRADYSLLDKYSYDFDGKPVFCCPISFFDGEDDIEHDIDGWRELTSGELTLTKLPGGHFYLKDREVMNKLLHVISRDFSGLDEIV